MKLIHKSSLTRGYAQKPSLNFISLQRQTQLKCKQSQSKKKMINAQFKKRYQLISPDNSRGTKQILFFKDKRGLPRAETNTAQQSRKDSVNQQNIQEWKILTLRQIKNKKEAAGNNQRKPSINQNMKKKYLSVSSKSQRHSEQNERRLSITTTSPKFIEIGGSHKSLEELRKRGRILQQLQCQIEESSHSVSLFCH